MKLRSSDSIKIIVFLAILFMFHISLYAHREDADRKDGNGKVPWNYRLSSKDARYVEVVVNTENVDKKYVVEDVSFCVSFYDSNNNFLGKKTFDFTGKDDLPLKQGRHPKKFRHSYDTASRVGEGVLYYSIRGKGSRLGTPYQYIEKNIDPELEIEEN